ncbi:MAG: STAS domain-containing protein [Steroidobacteraceae bacterium]
MRKHVTLIKWKTDAMKAGKSPKRVRANAPPAVEVAAVTESSPPPAAAADTAVRSPEQDVVALMPECTARNAEGLRAALLERLDEPGEVNVEVGAVERVDTVCVQLLVAFIRERTKHGRTTAWRGRSDPLVQAVALLGLGRTLAISDAV